MTATRSSSPASWSSRLASAALPLLVAVFLGAITVGVMGAEFEGPRVLGVLLRGFFGLVVGGIALFMGVVAVQLLFARSPAAGSLSQSGSPSGTVASQGKRLPAPLDELCPACGTAGVAPPWCPSCLLPLGGLHEAWRAEEPSWIADLFVAVIGAGLCCLGVFLAVGPFLEGFSSIWVHVATSALGLLVAGVGAVFLFGAAEMATNTLHRVRRWSCAFERSVDGAAHMGAASAVFAGGRFLYAHGHATARVSVGSFRRRRLAEPTTEQREFARTLTFLFARAHVALFFHATFEWGLGTPSKIGLLRGVERSRGAAPPAVATRTLMVTLVPSAPDEVALPLLEAWAPLALDVTTVRELWARWRDAPLHRVDDGAAEVPPDALLDAAPLRVGDLRVVEDAILAEIAADVLH